MNEHTERLIKRLQQDIDQKEWEIKSRKDSIKSMQASIDDYEAEIYDIKVSIALLSDAYAKPSTLSFQQLVDAGIVKQVTR